MSEKERPSGAGRAARYLCPVDVQVDKANGSSAFTSVIDVGQASRTGVEPEQVESEAVVEIDPFSSAAGDQRQIDSSQSELLDVHADIEDPISEDEVREAQRRVGAAYARARLHNHERLVRMCGSIFEDVTVGGDVAIHSGGEAIRYPAYCYLLWCPRCGGPPHRRQRKRIFEHLRALPTEKKAHRILKGPRSSEETNLLTQVAWFFDSQTCDAKGSSRWDTWKRATKVRAWRAGGVLRSEVALTEHGLHFHGHLAIEAKDAAYEEEAVAVWQGLGGRVELDDDIRSDADLKDYLAESVDARELLKFTDDQLDELVFLAERRFRSFRFIGSWHKNGVDDGEADDHEILSSAGLRGASFRHKAARSDLRYAVMTDAQLLARLAKGARQGSWPLDPVTGDELQRRDRNGRVVERADRARIK